MSRRDITNHHSCPEASKLQREAPWACSRIQHAIAHANVLAEEPQMHLESHTVHCAEVEALPLARAVLIVETCDALRVVLNARHLASIRLSNEGTPPSPAPVFANDARRVIAFEAEAVRYGLMSARSIVKRVTNAGKPSLTPLL